MHKRFFFIYILSTLISGCAEFYGTQAPAPIFGGHPIGKSRDIPAPSQQEPDDMVTTEPLQEPLPSQPESIVFKPEPLPPETEQDEPIEEPMETPAPSQPSISKEPGLKPAQEQASAALSPFEPLETTAHLSPAIGSLVLAADQNSSSGNLEAASATIERAIRIEPRNANLFYKLALIRIKQSKPRLAEDLAKKSALLAANDRTLKKHSWLLIAHARELQKNFKGAKEARAKANRL